MHRRGFAFAFVTLATRFPMHLTFSDTRFRSRLALSAGLLLSLPAAAQNTPAEAPVELDTYVVSALPFGRTVEELQLPVTVLADDRLDARRRTTIGASLEGLAGVAATSFGPGASRPILRGQDGERIRVLVDGLGMIDASGVSPDHAVALETADLERIEIVRGPATLLYGSSAAGGVVNTLDRRIPSAPHSGPVRGTLGAELDSVANRWAFDAAATGALSEAVVWHAAFARSDADDIEIPGHAGIEEHEEEEEEHEESDGKLENSAARKTSGSVGLGWNFARGRAGVAVSGFDTLYGIPGHGHHEEEEGEEEEHEEESVRIDLRQRRVDLVAELTEPMGFLESARWRAGFADYRHLELEGDEVGTRFDSEGWETRLDLRHGAIGEVEGAFGVQLSRIKLEADGEEAFLPPTRTSEWALFALEEWSQGPVRWQVGGRLERRSIAVLDASAENGAKLAASFSAGLVWTPSRAWTAALNLARTERAPTAQEWYANGPHLATSTFEIGDPGLGMEKSTGLDLTLRHRAGAITAAASVFYNDYDNYLYAAPTGEIEDDLPVFAFVGHEARFHGGELEVTWHAHEGREHTFDVSFVADTVRGRNRTESADLPRMPPWRVGGELRYRGAAWTAGLSVRHVAKQDRTAPDETATDSYTVVGADVSRAIPLDWGVLHLGVRLENATDADIRHHTSFTKDIAPLAGRNFVASARWQF